ncbi:MAG: hypothetical protein LBM21_00750 [Coriobacteriales bacterium]|nr:hypothetical protein [Coriobacteriales bacterium]
MTTRNKHILALVIAIIAIIAFIIVLVVPNMRASAEASAAQAQSEVRGNGQIDNIPNSFTWDANGNFPYNLTSISGNTLTIHDNDTNSDIKLTLDKRFTITDAYANTPEVDASYTYTYANDPGEAKYPGTLYVQFYDKGSLTADQLKNSIQISGDLYCMVDGYYNDINGNKAENLDLNGFADSLQGIATVSQ